MAVTNGTIWEVWLATKDRKHEEAVLVEADTIDESLHRAQLECNERNESERREEYRLWIVEGGRLVKKVFLR